MGNSCKYPRELIERATRIALDARRDPAHVAGAIARVAEQLGIHPEVLRNWVRRAEIDQGHPSGTTSEDAERIRQLERGKPRAGSGGTDSSPGQCIFHPGGARPPLDVIVGFVREDKDEHGVEPILTGLEGTAVSTAANSYYAARSRPASARGLRDAGLAPLAANVHADNDGVDGARKLWQQLYREGHICGRTACAVADHHAARPRRPSTW